MTAEQTTMTFDWRVYGLGVMALGIVCLAWGTSTQGSRCPRTLPTAPPSPMLTAYYTLIVVILMNGRTVPAHSAEFGTYGGAAEQLVITTGGLIVYAASAHIDATLAARLTRLEPHWIWAENALNLALIGTAWVVALAGWVPWAPDA